MAGVRHIPSSAAEYRALTSINAIVLPAQTRQDIATVKAKDLVRTRNYIKKFIKLGSQLQAVNLKMMTAKTQARACK